MPNILLLCVCGFHFFTPHFVYAAEFDITDRFSVDGYSEFRSTVTVKGLLTTTESARFAGDVQIGSVTAACNADIAGTIRWTDGHIFVCTGAGWRQLDNQPPPLVQSVSPAFGFAGGGTSITMNGAGFGSGATVQIGNFSATGVNFVSASQLTATTPAGPAVGAWEVTVTNPDGQYSLRERAFTYNPLPAITAITPNVGPLSGGTNITITGNYFVSGAAVTIANVMATNVAFVSAAQITATTPAGSGVGAKDVKVINPDTGTGSKSGGFTYCVIPTVTVQDATNIGANGAVLNGYITDEGNASATMVGFDYGLTTGYGSEATSAYSGGVGSFSQTISGLTPTTLYHFRAKAQNPAGWGYGTDKSFTTKFSGSGGTETTVNGYRIHTFTTSGNFTALGSGNVEVLVVAGGGGGGGRSDGDSGGGGGAGGVVYNAAYAVTPGAVTVTIGAGGAGATCSCNGSAGGNSVFGAITANGGGSGGGYMQNGGSGGSGGGGGRDNTHVGGSATQGPSGGGTGYGNAGGTSTGYGGGNASASGGGAGGAGSSNSGNSAGPGGVGMAFSISGSSAYYAGGGGGGSDGYGTPGAGGNGGGGSGVNNGTGNSGAANTGGGGGGGHYGGSGGSGVVIIRYPL